MKEIPPQKSKLLIEKEKEKAYEIFTMPGDRSFKKRWAKKGRLRTEFRDSQCIGTMIGFDNKNLLVLKSEKKLGDTLEDGSVINDIIFDKILIPESPGTSGMMIGFVYSLTYNKLSSF